jgi:hypothetical protein
MPEQTIIAVDVETVPWSVDKLEHVDAHLRKRDM